ncbi:MAG: hypothetical protein K2X27_03600, partial [Candidatus Obscuribacterales bacterium]|nr:hypothetical protein [Candidatus Obscuribacterales bacterium]
MLRSELLKASKPEREPAMLFAESAAYQLRESAYEVAKLFSVERLLPKAVPPLAAESSRGRQVQALAREIASIFPLLAASAVLGCFSKVAGDDGGIRSLEGAVHRDGTEALTVYGVTNRKIGRNGILLDSLAPNEMNYYRKKISLDSLSSLKSVNFDPRVEILSKEQFHANLSSAYPFTNGRIGVYFPGIRNSPAEAAYDAALLSRRLGQPFVVEDWASSSKTNSKWYQFFSQVENDYKQSFASQPMMTSSVLDLVSAVGAERLDLVAHSRGAVNQSRTLLALQALGPEFQVKSATFAHPDIDLSDFHEAFPYMYRGAKQMNFQSYEN